MAKKVVPNPFDGFSWVIDHVEPSSPILPNRHLRMHPREKIERLKLAISTHGFYYPIILGPDDAIVVGLARVIAARELGLKTIPAFRFGDLSPEQVSAIRIMDNKLAEGSEWNLDNLRVDLQALFDVGFNIRTVGFETGEIDQILSGIDFSAIVAGTQELEPIEKPVSQLGDIWLVGDHRIGCGNTLDETFVAELMDGSVAQSVITDPPYNVRITGHVSGLGRNSHPEFAMASGEMTPAEFASFNEAFLAVCFKYLAPGGLAYTFMDWRSTHVTTVAALDAGFDHVNTCVWNKSNGGMGSLYRSKHELVPVFRKPGGRQINNVQLGKHGRNRTNVWEYPGANSFSATRDEDLRNHPTVKPTVMIEDAIKDCTNRGDLVLDLFGGSGTTMLAAESCKRKSVLVEIDPGYVDLTLRRLKETYGIEAVHQQTGLKFADLADLRTQNGRGRPRNRVRATTQPAEALS